MSSQTASASTPLPSPTGSDPRSWGSANLRPDVLVIGGGPAGAASAFHCARAGLSTLVIDTADVLGGRDKTCGDGLTPRGVAALREMDAEHVLAGRPHILGLHLYGFGSDVRAPWPDTGAFPAYGSAMPRELLDAALLARAVDEGATFAGGVSAVEALTSTRGGHSHVDAVRCQVRGGEDVLLRPRWVILAEGARSRIARTLGVEWLRDMVHGVAARSYATSPRGDEPWLHSHVELRGEQGQALPGYGWIFPLGGGMVNLGCGTLVTGSQPVRYPVRKTLGSYAAQVRADFDMGAPQRVTSALLPMGGAVTRVAGANWATVGDAAALINPLNGEGIDYALESGRWVSECLQAHPQPGAEFAAAWPAQLRSEYGRAFSIARRLAIVLTRPGLLGLAGPVGMRTPLAGGVMGTVARLMGNLVTDADADFAARLWRTAGAASSGADRLLAAGSRPLFGRD